MYFGAGEDAIYLSGMAAGAATKTGMIGYVVPFPIPEVIRHANAFALGAQATHPGAKVKLVWTNVVVRPGQGEEGGREPRRRRRRRDRPERRQPRGRPVRPVEGRCRGSATTRDAKKFAPTSWLTAAVYNWGPYYLKQVKAADGRHLEDGQLLRQHEGRLHRARPVRRRRCSAKTKAAIAAKKEAIIAGTFYEFPGPIYDQAGKLRVPTGKRMTLQRDPLDDWLVKGVEGSPKG